MVTVAERLALPRGALEEFCRKHHIRRLSFFGSVVRDDFGPESDVDVLIEFEPGHTPGFAIIDIEDELSALFGGRKVDIVNPKYINHRLKDRILGEARVGFDAA
jgi:predicted nucleotidyltransferase